MSKGCVWDIRGKGFIGISRTDWNKRWFKFDEFGMIRYFVKEGDMDEKGRLDVGKQKGKPEAEKVTLEVCQHLSKKLGHLKFCMAFRNAGGAKRNAPFIMSVGSLMELEEWLVALGRFIKDQYMFAHEALPQAHDLIRSGIKMRLSKVVGSYEQIDKVNKSFDGGKSSAGPHAAATFGFGNAGASRQVYVLTLCQSL
eukprot:gene10228-12100_t